MMNFGNILRRRRKVCRSATVFRPGALQLAPNYSFIYVNIAVLKQKLGNYDDADRYFINDASCLALNYPVLYELYGKGIFMIR